MRQIADKVGALYQLTWPISRPALPAGASVAGAACAYCDFDATNLRGRVPA
jgi:hypothetical protein